MKRRVGLSNNTMQRTALRAAALELLQTTRSGTKLVVQLGSMLMLGFGLLFAALKLTWPA
jgi:hypothetical protein